MSAEVISMEEWQKAVLVDWAGRFAARLLLQLPAKDRQFVLQRLERAADRLGQSGDSK